MPGPGTSFLGGPVLTGTLANQSDFGAAVLAQHVTLVQNSTTAVSASIIIPASSQIVDVLVDTSTAWNSATSATLTVGTAAAGTQYASGVDVKGGSARQRPTFTAAQVTALLNVGANTTVVATVTPTGATSAGQTTVSIVYQQIAVPTGGFT